MAKKPVINSDEPTVGEGETTPVAVVAVPVAEVAAVEVRELVKGDDVPFFVTSISNGTLAEANAGARAQHLAEQDLIIKARQAAHDTVNAMFGGVAPAHVIDAVFNAKIR